MEEPHRDKSDIFDCIIIGAGPGGLQAAIYLGRFRRNILIIDRGGGRTAHAKSIENFLTQKAIAGTKIIELGMDQARSFGVRIEKALVTSLLKKEYFEVIAGDLRYRGKFVIVSTGVQDNIPALKNLHNYFSTSFFTCVYCDGYKTIDKKLVIIGNTIESVKLAFAMQEIYTRDVSLILYFHDPPVQYQEELRDRGIVLVKGEPVSILGKERMEAVELRDGRHIPCEVIMSSFGFKMNDAFLKGLDLKRDVQRRSFVVNRSYESSVNGLYVVGPLNTGNDQVVIAAGEGAVAAIDINKRLFEF